MNRKGVRLVVENKVRRWLETVEDEDLRKRMNKDVIVTGGCVASMLLGEKINDFDVYFRTKETTAAVAEHYLKRFEELHPEKVAGKDIRVVVGEDRVETFIRSAGVTTETDRPEDYEYFEAGPDEAAEDYVHDAIIQNSDEIEDVRDEIEDAEKPEGDRPRFRPVFFSSNAITLSDKIQIITRFFGSPEEVHANFDFVHCTCYWTKEDGVVLNEAALESLLSKNLRFTGSKYPVCALFRTRKFVARGWTITAGQMLKIIWACGELDLTNLRVLRDQLIGVDVAYFIQVVDRLQKRGEEAGTGDKVDGAYLLEIMDRMF